MNEQIILQSIINGLIMGAIYILIALGLTLLYGIMHIVNFAHGEIYMMGGFVCYYLVEVLGLNYFASLPVVIVVLMLVGIVLERFLFRLVQGKFIQCLLVTIGLSSVLQSLGWTFFGTLDKSVTSPVSGFIRKGGFILPLDRLVTALIGLFLVCLLFLLIRKTKMGRKMRAVEEDSETASLFGVNINRVNMLAFAIGCALAGVAGALVAPIFILNPGIGTLPMLKAFIIIILGGLGSIGGCVLGGFVLGVVDSVAGTLLGAELAYSVAFGFLILMIIIKPTGFISHD